MYKRKILVTTYVEVVKDLINLVKIVIKFIWAKYLSFKTKSIIKARCSLNFNTILEGKNVIHKDAYISNTSIGYGTYIGEGARLNNTSIGKYCSIAENVKIITGSHPTKSFVTTHPAFFSTKKQAGFTYVENDLYEEVKYSDNLNKFCVTIGNDVWIGADVSILEGLNIGDGAIIATGAVVVRNLEPYTIYGGVPAKKIKNRFSEDEKQFLLRFKWWENSNEWIKKNALSFSDINKFIELYSTKSKNGEGEL